MHETSRLLAIIAGLSMSEVAASFVGGVPPASRPIQTPRQLPAFTSVEVPDGGHVVLRPAQSHGFNLLQGSLDYSRVAVTNEGVLVIDKCSVKCPRGYRLEVEVLAPNVRKISFANGGWVRSQGSFAPQADLAARVSHGGTVDVRSMTVDRVTATVEQGGRILTAPRGSLLAAVTQGGAITYWGNPRVQESVQHGGVVSQGSADDLTVPLAELGAPVMPPMHHRQRKH